MNLPLAFEINRGQTSDTVLYLARSREGVLFFTEQGLTVAAPHIGAFRVLFEKSMAGTIGPISGERQLSSHSNYLPAKNGKFLSNIENFEGVRFSNVYPGIDVRFYGRERHLEHDFLLVPGADPSSISLRLEGIDQITAQNDGSVKLALGSYSVFETAPVAWQTVGGRQVSVAANWKLLDKNHLGIALGTYDHNLPLTIDPVLAYSTHLGGTTGQDLTDLNTFPADTRIAFVRLDPQGNIYVAGGTSATDYPTTAGAFDRNPNFVNDFHSAAVSSSGFVSKFDKTGRILIYSTFIRVAVEAMAVDATGHVYTAESLFDENPGPSSGADEGIFIDKLSPDGSKLVYSNLFGSSQCQTFQSSSPGALAVDNAGHAWLVGSTLNPCLPATPGAFQTKLPNNSQTGFAAKFDTNKAPANSLVYSTYLGGSTSDEAQVVTIDSTGNAYVAGTTFSADFPHGKVFGTTDGKLSAFVLKLNATGSALGFSALMRGASSFPGVTGIVLDSAKNVYISGTTASTSFPTTPGAFKRTLSGTNCGDDNGNPAPCREGFVTKLNPNASALVYSTFLGGSHSDTLNGLDLNNGGMAFVVGNTGSDDFPTTPNAFKKTRTHAIELDAFVTALQPNGGSLYYSTLLGGSKSTSAAAIFVDPAWNAWVVGNTQDSDFPVTPDAFQPGLKGNSDGFISKVVIASDLSINLHASIAPVARNSIETFIARVTNSGPDGSDAVVLTDVISSGWAFAGISGSTATSCTTPAIGATSGSVVCHKTRLENGQSFGVNILLRAIAPKGSFIHNGVRTSARTQDLNGSNNSTSIGVLVQ
ncbi:MAG TPA: SBBP repeat-containing protein [Candidatus Angelobacter sp.]